MKHCSGTKASTVWATYLGSLGGLATKKIDHIWRCNAQGANQELLWLLALAPWAAYFNMIYSIEQYKKVLATYLGSLSGITAKRI